MGSPNRGKEGLRNGSISNLKNTLQEFRGKEASASIKNLTLHDVVHDYTSGQVAQNNFGDAMSGPQSTKSGTAWPSSRYHKGQHSGENKLNAQKQRHNTQGSLNNFFNARQSSNLPSTNVNSNEHTPNTSSIVITQHQKNSSLESRKIVGTQPQISDPSQIKIKNYSAFVTRPPTQEQSRLLPSRFNFDIDPTSQNMQQHYFPPSLLKHPPEHYHRKSLDH